jgi:signal recognition particle GTPase
VQTEQKAPGNLNDELRSMGENLERILRIAWESEERKKTQREIETGLEEMAEALRGAARGFSESDTGREVRAELHEIAAKLREANLGERAREELLEALRRVNAELTRVATRWAESGKDEGTGV